MSETSEVEEAGATWRSAESDDAQPGDGATESDVRDGRVADPNLGDVPVDEQPHPGSDPDDVPENSEGAV